jgi:hypothetical protein
MADLILAGIGGLMLGLVLMGFFAMVAINRLERQNDRLRRNLGVVTEEVH